jgi:hypothetical protein
LRPWYDFFGETFITLVRSVNDELDMLERRITHELSSGIYSCCINSIGGARAAMYFRAELVRMAALDRLKAVRCYSLTNRGLLTKWTTTLLIS